MTLNGIDVSSNDGPIDWDKVAATGRRFAFVKATESTGYVNPQFAHDRAECHRVGFDLVGLYHFARPGKTAAADEAAHFLHVIGALGEREVAVLDIETNAGLTSAQLGLWARSFLDAVVAATARKPGIYSYGPFLDGMDLTGLPDRSWLWIAGYGSSQPASRAWPAATFWQYTDKASVSGVGVACDDSIFLGSDLAALTGPALQRKDSDMLLIHPSDGPDSGGYFLVAGSTVVPLNDSSQLDGLTKAGVATAQLDGKTWGFIKPWLTHSIELEVQEQAELTQILGALGSAGAVDVDKLATALSTHLGADVAKALGQKLSA